MKLVWRSEPRIFSHTVVSEIDLSHKFNLDKRRNGLEVAFGLVNYDSSSLEMEHVPEYGEIKAKIKTWSSDSGIAWKELELRPCTKVELGLGPNGFDDQDSKFFPMFEDSKIWYDIYWKKLYCVD